MMHLTIKSSNLGFYFDGRIRNERLFKIIYLRWPTVRKLSFLNKKAGKWCETEKNNRYRLV